MQRRMTPATPNSGTQAPQRLAEATLPRRVRVILDHVMDVASDELERLLQAMLGELEQQLFRLADHAPKGGHIRVARVAAVVHRDRRAGLALAHGRQ